MFKVLTLNRISTEGLRHLPRNLYEVASEIGHPDAILVRSQDMHALDVPETLRAVARAGAGVNNIPIDALTARGIPVFNAPGANANAVKELVLAGMLLAARNVCDGWEYVRGLNATGADLKKKVEAGKKQFVGFELPGRTLGVLGLGAIGVKVANTAHALGMRVVGFDPGMTVDNAWKLSAEVEQVGTLGALLSRSDFVSVHVPLNDATRGMLDAERLGMVRFGAILLNFSRGEVVDEGAVLEALASDHLRAYVTDFPAAAFRGNPKVIALPHLGASTHEAEANSAVMVAEQLRGYLEHGNIENSVNFPSIDMPRTQGCRLAVVNANVPNMVAQISATLGEHDLNIVDLLNRSRGEIAYTLVDVACRVEEAVLDQLRAIEGVLSVRVVPDVNGAK